MHLRLFLLAIVGLVTPLALQAQREKLPAEDLATVQKQWPDAKRTITGLRYVMLTEGSGEPPRPGDIVSVLYRGSLLNGRMFDENQDREKPFVFRLGRNAVIDGWDQGLQLLKPGGKMLLIVPHELGYGTLGKPPTIPRASTLVFEIEMLDVKREAPREPPQSEKKKKGFLRGLLNK